MDVNIIPPTAYEVTVISQTQLLSANLPQSIIPPTYPEAYMPSTIPPTMLPEMLAAVAGLQQPNTANRRHAFNGSFYQASCQPKVEYSQSIVRKPEDVPDATFSRPNSSSFPAGGNDAPMVNYKTFRKTVHPYQMRNDRINIKWDPKSFECVASPGALKQAHIWSLRMPKTPRNGVADNSSAEGTFIRKKRVLHAEGTSTDSKDDVAIVSENGSIPDSKRARHDVNTVPPTNYA